MPEHKSFLDLQGLTLYDTKIKEWVRSQSSGAEPESATEEDINNALGLPNWELVWANIEAHNNDTVITLADYLLKRTLGSDEDYIEVVSASNGIHMGYVTVDEHDQITNRGEEISDITVSITPSEILADAESCAASVTLDDGSGFGSTTLTGTATITRLVEEVLGG